MNSTTRGQENRLLMRLDVALELIEPIRHVVRSQLVLWKRPDLVDDIVLGVDELLANVYKHASSNSCTLLLRTVPDGVCVTVSDPDQQKPEMKEPGWDNEEGRGLHLVAGMSHNWGVAITDEGKDVWFSLLSAIPRQGESS